MSATINPVLPCEENEVVEIALTTRKGANLKDDFIPIVKLDKSYKEKGFNYVKTEEQYSLSPYIEERNYNLETITFDGDDEIVLRFEVKQGNSTANDNRGCINAIGHGVKIVSQAEFTIKYNQKILLRISKKEIKSGAYIDFYANDNDLIYYSVSHVHCGRVKIGLMCAVIFPFIEKPLNDINSSSYPKRYWGADAEANSATYGSGRNSGKRKHAGRDLYGTTLKTVIVAISDGVVLGNNSFYNGTNEIAILHTTSDGRKFIIRYGEVDPKSVKVKVNDAVKQGQEIAKVGELNPKVNIDKKVTNMLHFEYFTGANGDNLSTALTQRDLNKYKRRADLADPLPILKEGYENTFGNKASKDSSKSNDDRIPIANLKVSEKGLNFIKSWEGTKMNVNKSKHIVYDDSEGFATIGYGHLIAKKKCSSLAYSSSNNVIGGITKEEFETGITETRSLELLKSDIKSAEAGVKKDITAPLHQQEYDALVSLLYNAGAAFLSKGGAGGKDTKIKTNINNKNYEAGANEFADVTNGGVTGLVRRRKSEIKMFKTGIYENNN